MAGIGFRLQRLFNSGSYRSLVLGYAYSAVISSGPWMMSMLSLIAIAVFTSVSDLMLPERILEAATFRITVTYCYAGSLLLGGLAHLGVSRYISDRLYSNQMEQVLPCFMRSAAAMLGLGFIAAGAWFLFSGLPTTQGLAGIAMFQGLTLVWLCMVFLSAAKGYDAIVWGFFLCNVAGVLLALAGNNLFGLDGLLWGYALGQVALGCWLSLRIFREFPSYSPENNDIFAFLKENGYLVAVGFLFNFGIWIDKFIVWYSPLGTKIVGWFHCADNYDTCLFFSYLTVIPAMTLFLIRVETSFYRSYSIYFTAVTGGGDLEAIREGKEKIKQSLNLSASRLSKFQGGLTLALLLAAPLIAPLIGINVDSIPLLRFSLLAAFLQALLLFLLIFFLYFDWQREALSLAVFFVLSNIIFTGATLVFGREYLGLGYLVSTMLSIVFGILLFNYAMERLEFETFAKQVEIA